MLLKRSNNENKNVVKKFLIHVHVHSSAFFNIKHLTILGPGDCSGYLEVSHNTNIQNYSYLHVFNPLLTILYIKI